MVPGNCIYLFLIILKVSVISQNCQLTLELLEIHSLTTKTQKYVEATPLQEVNRQDALEVEEKAYPSSAT